MITFDFKKYNSLYVKDAKKITKRSTRPFVERKKLTFEMKKSYGNYDLFFNQKGVLLHSVHFDGQNNFKVIYGYNSKGMMISAMQLESVKNKLMSLNEYEYDKSGRIIAKTVRSFYYYLEYEYSIKQDIYTYTDNMVKLLIISEDDEDECAVYTTYDNKQREIEEKAIRNENEMIYWCKKEYDKDNNLIREISLNELGQQYGVYEFLPLKNGLTSGYIYKSENSNYRREYLYDFNEKGHWINQVITDDGEPIYIDKRTIEYY